VKYPFKWPHYAPVVYVVINLPLVVRDQFPNMPQKYLIWYATNQRRE